MRQKTRSLEGLRFDMEATPMLMTLLRTTTLACLISLAGAWPAQAQDNGSDTGQNTPSSRLSFHMGELDTRNLPNLLDSRTASLDAGRRYVLQLAGPITADRRDRLEGLGVRLDDYLPDHAYLCRLDGVDLTALAALPSVRWLGAYADEWKIAADFGERELGPADRQMLAAAGLTPIEMTFFRGVTAERAAQLIADLPTATLHWLEEVAGNVVASLTLPTASVAALADLPELQFVEEAPQITYRNNSNRWIVQSNANGSQPFYNNGLRGEGQVVGIMDGRVDRNHCSFFDSQPIGPNHRKILAYNTSFGADFHGTHVAGTALGDSQSDNNGRGVAYRAKLVFNVEPSFTESGIYNRLRTHHNQGARVHTNSWGDDFTENYNGLCRGIDSFSRDFEDSLVMFASTNDNVLHNPENAKNLIAVGASDDAPNQNRFCSGGRGPTRDGRRKPELFAPGCGTISSDAGTSCATFGLTGTSMASPAIAGTAALVRQYYVDGYYPSGSANPSDSLTPTGALIKATLLNSAVDMTGITGYPSNQEGWGRVLADDAVFFSGDSRTAVLLDDLRNASGLSTGQQREYTVQNTAAGQKLKVTLVFTDVPASASTGAGNAAVNDLDLEVVAPNGTLYRGNVFSGGVSTPGGSKDARNNVEQVHINGPAVGNWTIRVRGAAVNQGLQGFALLASGALTEGSDAITDCGPGAVNVACGPRQDVLTVNGSAGGAERTLVVGTATPLNFQIREAPVEAGDGQLGVAALYFWFQAPQASDVVTLPKQLGTMCFGPSFIATVAPAVTYNSIGFPGRLGAHDAAASPPVIPDGATLTFDSMPAGFGSPVDLTVQGFIPDDCTQGRKPFSVTNGMIVRVQ